jgi:hypothetical protein
VIEPSEHDVGRPVIYWPPFPGYLNGKGERGIITSFNEHFVFVRYRDDHFSKATLRNDLEWADDDMA